MKAICLILALLSFPTVEVKTASECKTLTAEKLTVVEKEWTDRDGVVRKVPYVAVLIRNAGTDVAIQVESRACRLEVYAMTTSKPPQNVSREVDCRYMSLHGRFLPGAASWSDDTPIDADIQRIVIVKVGTSEAPK